MEEKNDVSPDTLFTTSEIAEMYHASEYTITQRWVRNGLKHMPSKPFRFRKKWVEDYIEEQAELERLKRQSPICEIVKKPKIKKLPKFNSEMKINIEDYIPTGGHNSKNKRGVVNV